MAKRKEVEKFILDWIFKITNSKKNVELYQKLFKKMTNDEFDKFMSDLRNGKILQVIIPQDGFDGKIDLEKNFELANELGFDFFQHLTMGPSDEFDKFTTPNKHMVLLLPFRRTKQTLEKGIAVASSSKHIDPITGQVKEDDSTSSLSYPELQVLVGLGVKTALIELLRDRGGDVNAKSVLTSALAKYGRVSKKFIDMYSTGALSTKSLKAYLYGIHLKNNL